MYWFTADEHYHHFNILRYSNRPFKNLNEMHDSLIKNHNSVVSKNDTTIHAGDLSFGNYSDTMKIVNELNGSHVFLNGSHDYWVRGQKLRDIWERKIDGQVVVVCHYCMRTWPKSHYGSWQLYAHSHGKLSPIGKQHDVGVDNNNYFPVSFDQIIEIMKTRNENPGKIDKE